MKKGRKLVPVTYSGITYESVYDCAAAFGLSANVVRWRLKHSLPLEPALNFRRMVTYDGRVWSVRELAERCGVSPRTIAPPPAQGRRSRLLRALRQDVRVRREAVSQHIVARA